MNGDCDWIHIMELKLVGTKNETICEWFSKFVDDGEYEKMAQVSLGHM